MSLPFGWIKFVEKCAARAATVEPNNIMQRTQSASQPASERPKKTRVEKSTHTHNNCRRTIFLLTIFFGMMHGTVDSGFIGIFAAPFASFQISLSILCIYAWRYEESFCIANVKIFLCLWVRRRPNVGWYESYYKSSRKFHLNHSSR